MKLVVLRLVIIRVAALILIETIVLVLETAVPIVIKTLLVVVILLIIGLTAAEYACSLILRHGLVLVAEQITKGHLGAASSVLLVGVGSIIEIVVLRHTVIVPARLTVAAAGIAAGTCYSAYKNRKGDYP